MDHKRTAIVSLLFGAFFALAVEPAAAAFTWDGSATGDLIWTLNEQLLWVAVPITLLVEAILFYAVFKFRDNDDPKPTQENRRLEITWTVATAIILVFVGYASYTVMADPMVTAPAEPEIDQQQDPVEVEVVGQRWFWTYNYSDHGIERSSSTGEPLVLPTDRPVYLNVTSTDWLHAFHAPGLGLKQDAFPGEHHLIQTELQEEGTYQLYCAEYCGAGHSQMLGEIEVVSGEEFDTWVQNQQSDGDGGDGDGQQDGEQNETES